MGRKRRRKKKGRVASHQRPAPNAAQPPAQAPSAAQPPEADPVVAQLERDIEDATQRHRALLMKVEGADYAHLRRTHLAAQLVWTLRSDLCFRQGDHDAARKAATTADEHGKHAARLERDNIVDRIAALELELQLTRSLGRELAELE